MALPDSIKRIVGTPIIIGNAVAHGAVAANNNLGSITNEMDCKNLVAGAAWQSAKIDFTVNMDLDYTLAACVEWEASPEVVAGETLKFYMAWSNSGTPAVANPGGITGVDSAYTGYGAGSLADSLKQLDLLGAMNMDNVITSDQAQIDMAIAAFTPRQRYGTFVIYNGSVAAALHDDMVETSFALIPFVDQVQD